MRRPKGWGNQKHCIWFCVPCNLEMHGSKEIEYHFKDKHPSHESYPILFTLKQLNILPYCDYVIEDCRKKRNIIFKKLK